MEIDTERGNLSRTPLLDSFDWTSTDGVSPLLVGSFVFPATGLSIDLTSATTIALANSVPAPGSPFALLSRYSLTLTGVGFSLAVYDNFPSDAQPNLTQDAVLPGPALNNPYSSFNIGAFSGGYSAGGQLAITNISAPVPEPTTWSMMLVGFLGLGSVLRRKRAGLPRLHVNMHLRE